MGQTVNLLAYAFGGSTPSLPTRSINAQPCCQLGIVSKSKSTEGAVGGSNSVVESQPSKLLVAGSTPVSRSFMQMVAVHRYNETLK
jgi:hypothetical protein